jgi:hypothetical protein
MTATDYRMTRRGIFIGAAVSLIFAPVVVRAATLMPVRGLPLQFLNPEVLNPSGQFYRRCFYHSLDSDLRTGRAMSVVNNDRIISVAEAQQMIARAHEYMDGFHLSRRWVNPRILRY